VVDAIPTLARTAVAYGSADSFHQRGSAIPASRPNRRVIGAGRLPFTRTSCTDSKTTGGPFWLPGSPEKLKHVQDAATACIVGFFSARLHRSTAMEGFSNGLERTPPLSS
jgi:hypothetical protein